MAGRTHHDSGSAIDGSEGGYHDPYPDQSIDQVTAGVAEVDSELAPYNKVAPPMNNPSGRTAAQFWQLKYLRSSLQLSLNKKKAKAGL